MQYTECDVCGEEGEVQEDFYSLHRYTYDEENDLRRNEHADLCSVECIEEMSEEHLNVNEGS